MWPHCFLDISIKFNPAFLFWPS